MQNYRNNAMPYNSQRPAQVKMQMPERIVKKNELDCMPLAMAYVPWQKWQNIYEAEKGFRTGTIFQDLNLSFYGTGGVLR